MSLGKLAYRAKSYNEALDAFTRGLHDGSAPLTLVLLDARSATHEKLSDFKSALRDGRQMIKTVKSDARGYLRTGRVLQAMEKDEAALNIYALGIKHVDVKDKEFSLLQSMHTRLTLKLSPVKSVDPWTVLPVELVEYIVGYLGFKQMVRCLKVSKGWNRFLTSMPNLWMDLDLRFAKRPVGKKFVRSAILRSQRRIKTATLHRFADRDMLQALTRTCKQLERLEFLDSTFTNASVIDAATLSKSLKILHFGSHCDISTDTITQVLRHCPSLREIVVESFHESPYQPFWDYDRPSLEKLVLNGRGSPTLFRMNFASLIQRAKRLKVLELRGFKRTGTQPTLISLKALDGLERLVAYPSFAAFTDLPPSLRSLEAEMEAGDPNLVEPCLLQSWLPHLEELHLHGSDIPFLISALNLLINTHVPETPNTTTEPSPLKKLSFHQTVTDGNLFKDDALDIGWKSNPRLAEVEDFGLVGLNIQDRNVEMLPG